MTGPADIAISYGRGHLPLRIPAHAEVTAIRKKPLPKLADLGPERFLATLTAKTLRRWTNGRPRCS